MERTSYLNLLEECFPKIKANIARWEALGFFWETGAFFLKKEREDVVSHAHLLDYPMLIEGQPYRAGALHAICTKATHRGRGLASDLIREALDVAKERYEAVVLFTEIPRFYERLSFRCIQEYRFRLEKHCPKGSLQLRPLFCPEDNGLVLRLFQQRAPLSNCLWVKDEGAIASFSALFATYPTFWSLHYSARLDSIISYQLEEDTLHLFDVVAQKIPPLDTILDHLPDAVEQIYFYFSPDLFTDAAVPESYLYDQGHLMVHGDWPGKKPAMIAPLSRC